MAQRQKSTAGRKTTQGSKLASKTGKKKADSAQKPESGPRIGTKAPRFSMPVTGGGKVDNTNLSGKPYVLYFYPKDNTSGCTKEACDFRDSLTAFNRLGIKVIGVSKDNLKSHDKFKQQYGLKFDLASDAETKTAEAFGTWVKKSMYGRSYMGMERATYLVDSKGIIRAAWRKVSVTEHVDAVLTEAKKL